MCVVWLLIAGSVLAGYAVWRTVEYLIIIATAAPGGLLFAKLLIPETETQMIKKMRWIKWRKTKKTANIIDAAAGASSVYNLRLMSVLCYLLVALIALVNVSWWYWWLVWLREFLIRTSARLVFAPIALIGTLE